MTKARSLSDFIESDGSVTLVDNQKIKAGTGNDLEIYHDGTHSYVSDQGTGSLKIRGSGAIDLEIADGSEYLARFLADDAVQLYHNGSQKLATSSSGISVTGNVVATGSLSGTTASFTDDVVINTGSPELYFGTTGNHYNWRVAAQENVDAALTVDVGSQDTNWADDTYSTLFTVKNTGKVGINDSSPSVNLDVYNPSGWGGIDINGTSGGELRLLKAGTMYGNLYASDTHGLVINAANGQADILFSSGGTSKATILDTGSVQFGYSGAALQQADSQALSIITPASGGGQGIAFKRLDSNTDQGLGEISWSNNTQDGQSNIRVKTDGATNTTKMIFDVSDAGTVAERLSIGQDNTTASYPIVSKRNNGATDNSCKHYSHLCSKDLYGSGTGYTIIDTNIPHYDSANTGNMFQIVIKGFVYANAAGGVVDLNVGGYSGEGAIHNPSCSGSNIPNHWKDEIHFARKTATGTISIVLGNSSHSGNMSLAVTDFIQSYSNEYENYAVGWNIHTNSSLSAYDRLSDVPWKENRNVPAFRAYKTATSTLGSGVTEFNTQDVLTEGFDQRNNFNPANGRFTAPQPGAYQFNVSIALDSSTTTYSYISAEVRLNGGTRYVGGWGSKYPYGSAYAAESRSIVLSLSTGDYVTMTTELSGSASVLGASESHTTFSGHLIG
jgi:hypothetical protein